jgi:hypothetical protein
MRQRVTVGVAHWTLLKRNPHATENQLAPGLQTVNIIPQTDAD